ncbi:hypothetical protein OAV26_02360 [Crocinitomicaceae bacterium]|nr:hypothetical protein [Crocinitomicaceae bacterium]
MMNRILKRPMFRMGGRSDDGIMSLRPKYQEGGDVSFFTKIMDAINPPSGKVLKRMQDVQNAPSLGERLFSPSTAPLEFRTQAEANEFLEANPENIRPIKLLETGETINLPSEDTTVPDATGTVIDSVKTVDTGGETGEQSDQELIKSYMDMFSEAMGESEEDVSRQRYLELAKFGANLLGQPGGDLVGSIGRAAAPSIQGLAEGAARKSAANREIKLAGLKTAIAQMDDPTADKIKTLARMSGVSEKEVAKLMLDTDDGSDFELEIKALEGSVGAENAFKIAEQISDAGLKLSQVKPIPVDKKGKPKEGAPDGYYYDEDANIYKVEKGKPSILKTK